MNQWGAPDLEARLCRALDLAVLAIGEFGAGGYVDAEVPDLSFGPEKVVAEAAMLAYAASGASAAPEVGRRVAALAAEVGPRVRSQRALVELATQPGRAFKHAVPHVLLTAMGYPHAGMDAFFRSRSLQALGLGTDLPPSARLERAWISRRWGLSADAADDLPGTFLDLPIDILSQSRDEAYALTHLLFYLTDFGRRPAQLRLRPARTVLAEVEGLLLRNLDAEDYDLSGELLMAWPQLRAGWDPVASFAFRVLARVEDEVGVLPCGNVDADRMGRLEGTERRRYALATGYHTAFVMGFLCAVTLAGDNLPPNVIEGRQYPDRVWQGFLDLIDQGQGHWLQDFATSPDAEKRVLAPLLGNFAIVQNLRRHDYSGLARALALADAADLPAHPLRHRAAELLVALGEAMTVAEGAEALPN